MRVQEAFTIFGVICFIINITLKTKVVKTYNGKFHHKYVNISQNTKVFTSVKQLSCNLLS